MDIVTALGHFPLILSECAVSERLRRYPEITLHPLLFNTPLVLEAKGRRRLQEIYCEYRNIALQARLPILLCAPTWRADSERLEASGLDPSINRAAVRFLAEQRDNWQDERSPLLTGALLGPKNDCYKPELALSKRDAAAFHSWQAEELAAAGAELLIAQTMPAVCEALGMTEALGQTGLPFIISFVINRFGRVLDGTPLAEAIKTIDAAATRRPTGYMANCIYPTFIGAEHRERKLFERLIGIQANASSRDIQQLDGAAVLQQDPLEDWGTHMLELNNRYGLRILGGCCGTDGTYLRLLAGLPLK